MEFINSMTTMEFIDYNYPKSDKIIITEAFEPIKQRGIMPPSKDNHKDKFMKIKLDPNEESHVKLKNFFEEIDEEIKLYSLRKNIFGANLSKLYKY